MGANERRKSCEHKMWFLAGKNKLSYHVQKQIHQRCIIEVEMQFKLIPESLIFIFICYHLIGAAFLRFHHYIPFLHVFQFFFLFFCSVLVL